MGSNRTTIGNNGGENICSFTAAGDSGPLLYVTSAASTPQHNYSLVRGCTEFTLGLVGTGTGLQVTVYFTTDIQTALGNAGNWFLVAAPSTEASNQWSNPLINIPGQNICHFKANAIAFRCVAAPTTDGTPITGTTTVQIMGSF